MATRLRYYDSCLVRTIQHQQAEEADPYEEQDDGTYDGPKSMSFDDFAARKAKEKELEKAPANLDKVNEEAAQTHLGPLFERTVVPG